MYTTYDLYNHLIIIYLVFSILFSYMYLLLNILLFKYCYIYTYNMNNLFNLPKPRTLIDL